MTCVRAADAWTILAAALLFGSTASAVQAQTSSTAGDARPAAGGSAPMTVAVSLFASQESAPETIGALPEQGRAKVAFTYARQSPRNVLGISAGSIVPYSAGVREGLISYAGSLRFSSVLGRRTRLEIVEGVSQHPLDVGRLAAAGTPLDTLSTDTNVTGTRELRHDGAITVSRTLSRRSSAALSFTHTESSSTGLRTASSQLVAARVERRLSPSGVLHAGYGFGSATFATAETPAGVRHDIDLGLDFAKPLPFSGRTIFSVGTGTTVLSDGRSYRLRPVVSGSLSRHLGQTWSSRMAYSRPMQFVAGFQQPFLSDALSLNADGRVGGAWVLSVSSGVAHGSVGLHTGGASYDSFSTSVRVQRQVARAWSIEAESFAMRFSFAAGELTDARLPSRLARHGVRAGISWSTPHHRK